MSSPYLRTPHDYRTHLRRTGGLPDFTALKFTKYNPYESLVLPLEHYLTEHGVIFQFGTEVLDVDFAHRNGEIRATALHWRRDGAEETIELGEHDLALMTIGSLVDNSDEGDHHTPAVLNEAHAPAWDLWKRIAKKDPSFGRPEVFCSSIEETKWESATVTTLDQRIRPTSSASPSAIRSAAAWSPVAS
nr:oleate hydratase [Parenemella sanctibonifatiensis]